MRVAMISDTHLSGRSPESVANWHATRRAVERLAANLTIHLGDITLDGQVHDDELGLSSQLVKQWPTEMRCVPGNHDLGVGSAETPLNIPLLDAHRDVLGPDQWVVHAGRWRLLGINAQLLGTGSVQELALWHWIECQALQMTPSVRTALFLHRPLIRPQQGESTHGGHYVQKRAAEHLLNGPLCRTLRLVVSSHTHRTHQYLDLTVNGVRHVWMPPAAFIVPDDMQGRVGEKLVGIGLLDFRNEAARLDLWCPDGRVRHEIPRLQLFQAQADEPAAAE